jgi:hypothetical protein
VASGECSLDKSQVISLRPKLTTFFPIYAELFSRDSEPTPSSAPRRSIQNASLFRTAFTTVTTKSKIACDSSLKSEVEPYAYHQQSRTLLAYMNIPKTAQLHRRIQNLVTKPLLAVRFWWRHGPLTPEAAERVDRLCHRKQYILEVNSIEKP